MFGFNEFFYHSYQDYSHGHGHGWGHYGSYWDWDFDTDDSESVVMTGQTNTDGTGSSVNLSLDNATLSLVGDGSVTQDGVTLTHSTDWWGYSSTSVYSDEWNADGYKEAQISNSDDYVSVENITDINIVNTSDSGVDILVSDAKRGVIDTADGDDHINITAYSNNDDTGWGNDFVISTHSGNDSVSISDGLNSQNSSFNVNLGNGDDTLDLSSLNDGTISNLERHADGGDGLDTLIFSGQDTVQFENFEVIQGADNAELTVDSDLLASNDSSWFGLVVSNVDVSFDDSVSVASTDDLSFGDSLYLAYLGLDASDYSDVTVTADDGSSYHVLTDDSHYSTIA